MMSIFRMMFSLSPLYSALPLLLTFLAQSSASAGDQSSYFQRCVGHLSETVCENQTRVTEMKLKQSLALKLTMWDCIDESRYHCMWATVKEFRKYTDRVPQFYGKWPFIRFLGMQEPASAIFSVFNGISFFMTWRNFKRKVPKNAPTYYVWSGYALVSMNAWFWSTIFHIRDTVLTEMLDYFCASSGVLFSFFGLWARMFYRRPRIVMFCAFICLNCFVMHTYYLAFVHFDYGYNMKASVSLGIINSIGWLSWCYLHWYQQPYVWKCSVVVLVVNALLMLELGDFSPIWWTFDAHSLWHLGTIPLPLLFFSFVTEDCNYLLKKEKVD